MAAPSRQRRVFRPRRARLVVYPLAVLVVVVLGTGAVVLPSAGRAAWSTSSRVALVALALAVAWFLHRLGSVRVETDEDGLTVVNILTRRRLTWPEVVDVRLGRSDAWLVLDTSDGDTLPAMGVQRSDGAHAEAQALDIARLVVAHSRVERDD